MNAKRLIMSFGMLAFVGAVVVGGTGAFFSDEITSEGNVFTAGSVTLGIANMFHEYNGDGEGADQPEYEDDGFTFSLSDLKPLDEGEVTYRLENGANAAHVCAMVEETDNSENGRVNPEMELGDTGPDGELGDYLSFNFGGNSGTLSAVSGMWQEVGAVDANDLIDSSIEYCFGEYDDESCVLDDEAEYNWAQTDSLTADVSFYAVQTRNNENFSCASLNEDEEEVIEAVALDDWPTLAGAQEEHWKAEGRLGNNGLSGDWELGVGDNTQVVGQFDEGQTTWSSGVAVPFTVNYDGDTATFTLGGESVSYDVDETGIDASSDLYFVAKGATVELENLTLNSLAVNPVSLQSTGSPVSLRIDGVDVSSAFTASGDATFTFGGGDDGSDLDFQVVVAD